MINEITEKPSSRKGSARQQFVYEFPWRLIYTANQRKEHTKIMSFGVTAIV